jgi:hypothetical protein
MTFDARSSVDPSEQAAFVEWLVSEAAAGLARSRGNRESLRAQLFLFLGRGYEAHLDPDRIADLIGASQGSILDRAGLSQQDEAAVIHDYEALSPLIEATYKLPAPGGKDFGIEDH